MAPELGTLHADDLRIIRAALRLYCKNCRAASGTLKGLGKDKQSVDLQAEADDVEQRLLIKFDEQGTLDFGQPPADPTPGALTAIGEGIVQPQGGQTLVIGAGAG